jgi:methyl-accepting chemotaxis protein
MVPGIQRTAELVHEIAVACGEQDASVGQISQSIERLDGVIRRNAATTDSIAATAGQLATDSEHLKRLMQFFRVDAASAARPVRSVGRVA